jgi:tRNA modification GTPase
MAALPLHPQDTLVALSSASGPSGRAIVRLSGPGTMAAVATVFRPTQPLPPGRRGLFPGELHLPDLPPLPADLYCWPGPHSYTGQDMAELHLLSSPPLVELLLACLLQAGCRAAQPGELTLRGFLAGKLDLTRAEAVHAVIAAGSRDELKHALAQLAGGMARPLAQLREDLLNLLADVEAGLDFSEEDIRFVGGGETLLRLGNALAQLTVLRRQLSRRGLAERPFRAVLVGRPNAGKSSLFNALGGQALVSPQPGTTRDYLVLRLDLDGVPIELIDTAGWQGESDPITSQAQTLGHEQAQQADLLLLCLPAGDLPTSEEALLAGRHEPPVLLVATKCDQADAPPGQIATSAYTGAGVDVLHRAILEQARGRRQPALAPSLSRCTHHVEACLAGLRRAHHVVIHEEPAELLALELRGALDQLGEMTGAIYTDDLLDRIFSRFCIGK